MVNLYAYDAGYADGMKSESAKVTVNFHELTIQSNGVSSFGLRCGLTDHEIVTRGHDWEAACREYDRGWGDGHKARH